MRTRGVLAGTVLSVLSGLTLFAATQAGADTGTAVTPAVTAGSGLGFDACTAPATAKLRAWTASPFRTVNMYFSGRERACPNQPELSKDWVTTALANGWSLIPTVVDLQPPCYRDSKITMSSDPNVAAQQGQSAATTADTDLKNLGLGGTIAYLDFENFTIPSGDTTCAPATLAFAHAWVTTLHGLRDKAGIYFNANPNQGVQVFVDDYANASTRPDDIWYASYDGNADTTSVPVDKTTGQPTIPPDYWVGHRIHQYRGGMTETYGTESINIDRDAVGGDVVSANSVVTPSGAPPYTYAVVGASTLNERTQPSGSATVAATANRGDPLPIMCQTTGQSVDGDFVWDKLANGAYVSDIYTSTTGQNGFSSGIPKCDTTRPKVSLTPLPAVTLASAVTIRWSASDGTDPNGEARGISSSQLRYRIANYTGGFGAWHYRSTTSFSNSLALGAGHSYCVQVRSFDLSGNSSAWSNQSCVGKPLDDRSMSRSSGWTLVTKSHFYLGTATSTTSKGRAMARTHASLDRVGVVATTCSSCGSLRVYVGSHYVGTVKLHASSTHYRRVFLLPAFSQRSGTVRLVTDGKLVQIDGILITRI